MNNQFNENSRVKIPAILHLARLGYTYITKKDIVNIHPETNILVDIFKESISKINKKAFTNKEIDRFVMEINTQLDNNDLGKKFYNSLLGNFDCKLIDFENFEKMWKVYKRNNNCERSKNKILLIHPRD